MTRPVLELSITPELRSRAKQYVDAKFSVERSFNPCFGDLKTDGMSFYRQTVPFTENLERDDLNFGAMVPTDHVLSESWRWHTPEVQTKCDELLTLLLDEKWADPKGSNRAEYFWIKPLGLLIAHEGKNRVGFMRDMAQPHIPAVVMPCGYHAPDRLKIYEILVCGRIEFWCVLDTRFMQRLEHPSFITPLMSAYGVEILKRWPSEYPTINEIMRSLEWIPNKPCSESPMTHDLHAIESRILKDNEEIICTAFEVKELRVRWRWIIGLFCGALSVSVIASVLPSEFSNWSENLKVIAAMLGVGGFSFSLPLYKTKRKFTIQH